MATILVVMGVCGSGKTSVAERLAAVMAWHYHEADWSHSDENKAKMGQGIPLTDEDRWPWLLQLHQVMTEWRNTGQSGVLTCSALKRIYRDVLVFGSDAFAKCKATDSTSDGTSRHNNDTTPQNKPQQHLESEAREPTDRKGDIDIQTILNHVINSPKPVIDLRETVKFVYLKGDRATLASRLSERRGHFMPLSLLDSQLATLEEPADDENHINVEISGSLQDIVSAIIDRCSLSPGAP